MTHHHIQGVQKVLNELLWQNLLFVIVILGNILDQNLLEHLAFEKDRERMHEGCVTENPFFAFDKVVYFSYVDLFRIASNTSRH